MLIKDFIKLYSVLQFYIIECFLPSRHAILYDIAFVTFFVPIY